MQGGTTTIRYITKLVCFAFQNKDGRLTKDEFREGSKSDPWIVEALSAPHR